MQGNEQAASPSEGDIRIIGGQTVYRWSSGGWRKILDPIDELRQWIRDVPIDSPCEHGADCHCGKERALSLLDFIVSRIV